MGFKEEANWLCRCLLLSRDLLLRAAQQGLTLRSLYRRERNLRFYWYDLASPTPHVDELIAEIERDPTSIV